MSYTCPRCGSPVQHGSHSSAALAVGLIGSLLMAAFGAFECKKCGKIPQSEFPPEVRSKIMMGSVGMAVGAVVLVIVLFVVLAALKR